jgi:ParB-like chromosome segregation protein Spo0J
MYQRVRLVGWRLRVMIEHKRFAAVNGIAAEDDFTVNLMGIVDRLPEVSVPIASLVPGFHLRTTGVDAAHAQLLADAAATVQVPSILVQKNGARIIDGMHRIEAARLRGDWSIKARVVDCSDEEALILAIRSNTLHGLPLSKADRIAGAKRILAVHPDWSDRAVAGVSGLSAKVVASLRSSAAVPQIYLKRLGQDGKRRPMVPGEGRLRAAEYIAAHPEASVRQVAREVDVSVGTVQKVRESLRSGAAHQQADAKAAGDRAAGDRAAGDKAAGDRVDGDRAAGDRAAGDRADGDQSQVAHPAGRGACVHGQAWAVVAPKLHSDPALRYTEGGRAFLRWMGAHSMQADEWREFVDAIPAHWLDDVRRIAFGMAGEWRQFAEWMTCTQERA